MNFKFKFLVFLLLITFAFTACIDSGNNNGTNSTDNNNGNNNNNNNNNDNTTTTGKLYAKAPPILASDTPVDLSGTTGANVVDKSFTYINTNPGTYTLVMNSDIDFEGEYLLGMGDPPVRHLKTANVKLTIIGDDEVRKISLSDSGRMFTVGEPGKIGISLTLGKNIILNGDGNGFDMVCVQNNASFVMQDNSKLSGGISNGVKVSNNSTFILKDSASVTGNGGTFAVTILDGSTFTIQDNASVSNNYIGLIVADFITGTGSPSTLIMKNNASISNNESNGIHLANSSFLMQDNATVSNNKSTGIRIGIDGDCTIQDSATISGNNGGVSILSGTLTMKDNAVISGNRLTQALECGGGILVKGERYNGVDYLGYFIMQGGTISGNSAGGMFASAGGMGGGVAVEGYGNFVFEGGTIYGSDASETLKNNAWMGAALYKSSSSSATTAKYGDGTDILPHDDGDQYRTNNTITGRQ